MNFGFGRGARRTGLAAAAVIVALVALAAPAAADTLTIREIDTSAYPEVRISAIVSGDQPDLASFTVRENDKLLDESDYVVRPIGETAVPVGIVLAIDVSGSMRQGNALDEAKAAAKRFVSQRLENDRIALVAFGSNARVVVNFTARQGLLNKAIDDLVAQGETALYDGIRKSVALFTDRPELQPNIVVLTDGKDTVSAATERQAKGSAVDANATVFTVGIQTPDFSEGPMRAIAADTGGTYFPATDAAALTDIYESVQRSIQNQYLITYKSAVEADVIRIAVSATGVQDTGEAPVGAVARGANTEPVVLAPPSGVFAGDTGKWVGLGLGLVAIILLAYAVVLIFVRERSGLAEQISLYTEGVGEEDDDEDSSIITRSGLRSAVEMTGRFAERQGIQTKVEAMLEQANVPLRAGEALFFYAAAVFVGSALWLLITRSLGNAVLMAVVLALGPPAVLSFMAGQRRRRFVGQLPDTLQLLSGSLRAGYSLMQGVETVAQEVDDPMGKELRRIVAESRLGRPLEDALDDSAERMDSPDFAWAVMAIKIQREVGGNLAELLETVGETMIARERLRRDVNALTAEGRISALVLGILPLGMLAILWAINRTYIEVLFEETVGKAMLLGGALLAGIGFYWLKKTVEIEI